MVIAQFILLFHAICDNSFIFIMSGNLFLCGYLLTSAFFFIFPKYIHKVHKYTLPLFQQVLSGQKIINICHRGAPRVAAQNSIKSFSVAQEVGDMLEMDVCVTKDNILVVHHDKDLMRTCGVQKNVSQLEMKELPRMQKQIQIHFGKQGQKVATENDLIPTLKQVLEKFPNTPMNIQLKTSSQPAIISFVRLLNDYKRSQTTIVGIRSQNHKQLALLDNKTLRFCSDASIVKILIAYFTGLLPFLPIRDHALQIPLYTLHFYEWKQREWKNPFKSYVFFLGLRVMNWLMIPLVWHLRKRGVMTFYWVCNNEEEFKRAQKCGAAGIITDEPFLFRDYIAKQQKKVQ